MAYAPSAATTSHTAEIFSPRASARTPQATAPSSETVAHSRTDRGDMRERPGRGGTGRLVPGMADVGMAAPHLKGEQRAIKWQERGVRIKDRGGRAWSAHRRRADRDRTPAPRRA